MTETEGDRSTEQDDSRRTAETLRLFRISVTLAGLILVAILVGGLLWLRQSDRISDTLLAAFAAGGTLIVVAATLLNYLGDDYRGATLRFVRAIAGSSLTQLGDVGATDWYRVRDAEYRMLVRRLLAAESKARPAVRLTDHDRETVVKSVVGMVRGEVAPQLLESIEQKYSTGMVTNAQTLELRHLADRTRGRLLDEVAALSRRSNVNLVIGIVTTASAVALLAYIVLSSPQQVTDWHLLIPSYSLRLSLVIFVEIFAFFFLRMYRVNLQEIKYFQNELTSIEAKLIALETTIRAGDAEAVRSMTVMLGGVERNILLQQGQSTVELERLKLENGTLKSIIEGIGKVVPGRASESK
jgi:hypothetical protein